ncbi:MAG: DUF397 domain-containing protein [Pseudonocardiaceae bacterium]|nr:DUF397 domain-containing protein [Pseudonocardiaceae bacterium]
MLAVDLATAGWRKSSYSTSSGQNGDCVEVAFVDASWRKSSYSTGDGHNGDCVEVAFAGLAVAVRDSKHPDNAALVIPAPAWQDFLAGVMHPEP